MRYLRIILLFSKLNGLWIPHGIKSALILFDKDKNRIIGFDNAHGFKSHRRIQWDHFHKREKVFPYVFKSAAQLLEDFWEKVNQYLENQE